MSEGIRLLPQHAPMACTWINLRFIIFSDSFSEEHRCCSCWRQSTAQCLPAKHKAVSVTAVINSCQEQRSCYIARSKLSSDGESPLVLLLLDDRKFGEALRVQQGARTQYSLFSRFKDIIDTFFFVLVICGSFSFRYSAVDTATSYTLGGPGFESR